jgi:hybrid cluster-associated redox disulfide protein
MPNLTLPITQDAIIGELLDDYPQALGVIEKHFGGACFTCPGVRMETIGFGAMIHGLKPEAIVEEINAAIGSSYSLPRPPTL